jgi:hypothetical protein
MSTIITRLSKGEPLSTNDMDSNLINLNNDKVELADLSVAANATASGDGSISYDNGVFTYTPADVSSFITEVDADNKYLQSFTEANDLSAAVVWSNVPDANITQSSVSQHQASLSVSESQISDLGSYLTNVSNESISDLSDVTIATPSEGETLVYTNGSWANAEASGSAEISVASVGLGLDYFNQKHTDPSPLDSDFYVTNIYRRSPTFDPDNIMTVGAIGSPDHITLGPGKYLFNVDIDANYFTGNDQKPRQCSFLLFGSGVVSNRGVGIRQDNAQFFNVGTNQQIDFHTSFTAYGNFSSDTVVQLRGSVRTASGDDGYVRAAFDIYGTHPVRITVTKIG